MAGYKTLLKVRLLLFKENKLLLLKQTPDNGGRYTLVGGNIEDREAAYDCLIRECYEEVGIILRRRDLRMVHVLHKRTVSGHRITLYFSTEIFGGIPQNKEPHKFSNVKWHNLNSLPTTMTGTVRHVLNQLRKGNLFSEYTKKEPIPNPSKRNI